MSWWASRREQAKAASALGRPLRVLSTGHGDGVTVLGLEDGMAVGHGDQWHFVAWHLVRHGGWDEQQRTLSWVLADETPGEALLSDPGRIPEMFQERVKATIVVEDRTSAPGGGAVVLVGRRALGGDPDTSAAIVWQVLTEGPARLDNQAVREHILTRVRALEWDYSV